MIQELEVTELFRQLDMKVKKGKETGKSRGVREREFTDMGLELSPGEDLCIRAEMWKKINGSEGLGKRKQGSGKIRRR